MTPDERQLIHLIESLGMTAQAESGDFDQIAVAAADQTIEQTDSTRRIMDDLIDVVGALNANTVLATLAKAGRGEIAGVPAELCLSEWHALNGVGTDVSRPGVQSLVKALGQLDGWPDGLADIICRLGVWHISPAEAAGREVAPTSEELRNSWVVRRIYKLTEEIKQRINMIATASASPALAEL